MKKSLIKKLIIFGAALTITAVSAMPFALARGTVTTTSSSSGTTTTTSASGTTAQATVRPLPNGNSTSGTSTGNTTTTTVVSNTSATSSDSEDEDTAQTGNEEGTDTTAAGTTANGTTSAAAVGGQAAGAAQQTTSGVVEAVNNSQNMASMMKKYASKGSLAVWIILTMLINAIVSFLIANRFYKMAKKDTHVTSEIRALRKDIEEKMVEHVGGFSEMQTDVKNTNESYAANNGGIKRSRTTVTDISSAEAEDIFRRWESQLTSSQSQQRQRTRYQEDEEDYEVRKAPRRRYQPQREEIEGDFEDDEPVRKNTRTSKKNSAPSKQRPVRTREYDEDEYDEYDEEYDEEYDDNEKGKGSIKDKAKSFISDIFPFKED